MLWKFPIEIWSVTGSTLYGRHYHCHYCAVTEAMPADCATKTQRNTQAQAQAGLPYNCDAADSITSSQPATASCSDPVFLSLAVISSVSRTVRSPFPETGRKQRKQDLSNMLGARTQCTDGMHKNAQMVCTSPERPRGRC